MITVKVKDLDKVKVKVQGEVIIEDSSGMKTFEGPYVVTPKMAEQVLPTKQKKMRDDLTVEKVPVYEVTNSAGGTTVYIASEVN